MCVYVYLYIHKTYKQYTHICYVKNKKTFILDAINHD